VNYGDGALDALEGPAELLGHGARNLVLECFGRWGRLGIFEPCDGFGEGSLLAGGCAFGGVGLYERVHIQKYHRLWYLTGYTTICGADSRRECGSLLA